MIEIYWNNQLNSGLWWWTLKQSLGPLPGETGPSDATISWRIFFFRLAGVDLRVMEGSSRDAARSLFWGRSQGLVFLAENKHFPTEEKVCFSRGKRFFLPWWYMLGLGKKTQDLSNRGFWCPKETFFAPKGWFPGSKQNLSGNVCFKPHNSKQTQTRRVSKAWKNPTLLEGREIHQNIQDMGKIGEISANICKYTMGIYGNMNMMMMRRMMMIMMIMILMRMTTMITLNIVIHCLFQ